MKKLYNKNRKSIVYYLRYMLLPIVAATTITGCASEEAIPVYFAAAQVNSISIITEANSVILQSTDDTDIKVSLDGNKE